jgi:adenylosuccinate synthase
MSKAYILSGTLFGDEGKGSFVDYIAYHKNITKNIRYNGGSQASHTVVSNNNITHKFSQLGSSMFLEGNRTLLSENTIINLFNLVEEAKVFAEKTNTNPQSVIDKIFISSKCKIVTPYHILCNEIRELSSRYETRGSVGTGVSEVINIMNEANLCLYMSDLFDGKYIKIIDELFVYTLEFFNKNTLFLPANVLFKFSNTFIIIANQRHYTRDCYKALMSSIKFNVVDNISQFTNGTEDIVFEGSQGLLLDKNYGIKPNTTLLDTTNHYAIKLANDLKMEPIKIGIIKAFASRHGIGVLPTYDMKLSKQLFDSNQTTTAFQGRDPIYGWFDCVLLKYAHKINNNTEYFLSHADQINNFRTLKICHAYIYNGKITKDFDETFEYHWHDNKIFITDILKNSPQLSQFLNQCTPSYAVMSRCKKGLNYIDMYLDIIKSFTDIKITLISIGPTRNDKRIR